MQKTRASRSRSVKARLTQCCRIGGGRWWKMSVTQTQSLGHSTEVGNRRLPSRKLVSISPKSYGRLQCNGRRCILSSIAPRQYLFLDPQINNLTPRSLQVPFCHENNRIVSVISQQVISKLHNSANRHSGEQYAWHATVFSVALQQHAS